MANTPNSTHDMTRRATAGSWCSTAPTKPSPAQIPNHTGIPNSRPRSKVSSLNSCGLQLTSGFRMLTVSKPTMSSVRPMPPSRPAVRPASRSATPDFRASTPSRTTTVVAT